MFISLNILNIEKNYQLIKFFYYLPMLNQSVTEVERTELSIIIIRS
jgi:hypothetical protein